MKRREVEIRGILWRTSSSNEILIPNSMYVSKNRRPNGRHKPVLNPTYGLYNYSYVQRFAELESRSLWEKYKLAEIAKVLVPTYMGHLTALCFSRCSPSHHNTHMGWGRCAHAPLHQYVLSSSSKNISIITNRRRPSERTVSQTYVGPGISFWLDWRN